MSRNRVSIKDVARAAEVSTQTVSRVLNERPDVAPATRQRVQEVIARLGYQPSSIARSLIRRRTYCLGVVISGLKYVGPSRLLAGIVQQADAHGYSVTLRELPSMYLDDVEPALRKLLEREVDGIIWGAPEVGNNRDWVQKVDTAIPGTPRIFLTMEPRDNVSIVQVDNYAGGCLATQHLVEQGYRHIGHVSGPMAWWEARERKRGWRDVLAEAGLAADENQCVAGDWSSASGEAAFLQLRGQFPEMQAIFVANDQMALGAMYAARQQGVRVPEDVALVGCDAIPEGAYFSPPLTTVLNDTNEVGRIAVDQLLEMIDAGGGEDTPYAHTVIALKPELIVRQSSVAH